MIKLLNPKATNQLIVNRFLIFCIRNICVNHKVVKLTVTCDNFAARNICVR